MGSAYDRHWFNLNTEKYSNVLLFLNIGNFMLLLLITFLFLVRQGTNVNSEQLHFKAET